VSSTRKDGTWRKIMVQVLKGDATPRPIGYYAPTGNANQDATIIGAVAIRP
jgi:hypothetical protein